MQLFTTTISDKDCAMGTILYYDHQNTKFRKYDGDKPVKRSESLGILPCRRPTNQEDTRSFYLLCKSTLTLEQYTDILQRIKERHSFMNGRSAKYIDSTIDTRDWSCFNITLRDGGRKIHFTQHITLIHTDEDKITFEHLLPMYDTILRYLGEEK